MDQCSMQKTNGKRNRANLFTENGTNNKYWVETGTRTCHLKCTFRPGLVRGGGGQLLGVMHDKSI